MDFFSHVDHTQDLLSQHGQLSLRGLMRQFADDRQLIDEIVAELEVRGVARWEGDILVALDSTAGTGRPSSAPTHHSKGRDLQAELRLLTVLFCDAVGSTALSDSVDPELWTEAIGGFLRMAASAVESFDGCIGGYQGDGLIAYFGYPIAQEDAAERAVRAGLAMISALASYNERVRTLIGCDLQMRVGVHSGPVIVDHVGGTVQALGKTANIASRVEGVAPVNGVAITAATRRLAPGVFVLDELGPYQLKGVREPVEISRVIGVGGASRRLSGHATARTMLVGRDAPIAELRERWRAATDGHGQMVEIAGEAGIGKSRLVDAFRESVADEALSWLDAACSPYSHAAPLLPIIELQRRGLGFSSSTTADEMRETFARALTAVGVDAAHGVPLLADLHGLSTIGAVTHATNTQRTEVLALLVEWLVGIARVQPTVLLIEDVHWADPTTIELLARLGTRIAHESILVLMLTRPDGAPQWRRSSNFSSIGLGRIGRDEIARLATDAAGRVLTSEVLESIVRRSDGVPLFVEELAAALRDTDVGVGVPDTLHNLLMARLERLGRVRDVAQVASVLGREFDPNDLELFAEFGHADLQGLLDTAVEHEIFFRRGFGNSLEYYFKHALLRDVVYDSMLARQRCAHHRRYAQALIESRPDRAAARPDLIAEHFAHAEDQRAASEWWQRAAELATSGAATSETEYFYRRAIETTDEADVGRLLQLKMGLAGTINAGRTFGHPDLGPIWESVLQLAQGPEFAWPRAVAQAARTLRRVTDGRFAEARMATAATRALANEIGAEDVLLACAHGDLAMLNFEGRPTEVVEKFDELMASNLSPSDAFDRTVTLSSAAMCHAWYSYSLAQLGRFDDAFAANDRAVEVARDALGARPVTITNLLTLRSTIFVLQGNMPAYLTQCEEFLASARRFELPSFVTMGLATAGLARLTLFPDAEKLRGLDQAVERLIDSGNLLAAPIFAWSLAGAQLACGQLEPALRTTLLAADLATRTGQQWYDGQLLARRLRIEQQLGVLADDWRDEIDQTWQFTCDRSLVIGGLHVALVQLDLAGTVAGSARVDVAAAADRVRIAVSAVPQPTGAPLVERAQDALAALS